MCPPASERLALAGREMTLPLQVSLLETGSQSLTCHVRCLRTKCLSLKLCVICHPYPKVLQVHQYVLYVWWCWGVKVCPEVLSVADLLLWDPLVGHPLCHIWQMLDQVGTLSTFRCWRLVGCCHCWPPPQRYQAGLATYKGISFYRPKCWSRQGDRHTCLMRISLLPGSDSSILPVCAAATLGT